ncbi:hypothetical protein QN277_006212 [Acacia crassicarpa]|uniref:Uncharacterized protein n=1 Tax=Acacia crassicarpa TaxID=499986 RepID=A0AAE1J1B8_9FABA|nr:hypothetical protein QN277_006212 [Acacia crassicarpa]
MPNTKSHRCFSDRCPKSNPFSSLLLSSSISPAKTSSAINFASYLLSPCSSILPASLLCNFEISALHLAILNSPTYLLSSSIHTRATSSSPLQYIFSFAPFNSRIQALFFFSFSLAHHLRGATYMLNLNPSSPHSRIWHSGEGLRNSRSSLFRYSTRLISAVIEASICCREFLSMPICIEICSRAHCYCWCSYGA